MKFLEEVGYDLLLISLIIRRDSVVLSLNKYFTIIVTNAISSNNPAVINKFKLKSEYFNIPVPAKIKMMSSIIN